MDDDLFARTVAGLTADDPHLAELVATHGTPALWLRPTGFAAGPVHPGAAGLAGVGRGLLSPAGGVGAVTPETVLACTPEELRPDGVSRQKDGTSGRWLTAVLEAPSISSPRHLDDDTVRGS